MPLTEKSNRCYSTLKQSCFAKPWKVPRLSPAFLPQAPTAGRKPAAVHPPRPTLLLQLSPAAYRRAAKPFLASWAPLPPPRRGSPRSRAGRHTRRGGSHGRAPALPPVRRLRRDGRAGPGRSAASTGPLKPAPIYISRRLPAPARPTEPRRPAARPRREEAAKSD